MLPLLYILPYFATLPRLSFLDSVSAVPQPVLAGSETDLQKVRACSQISELRQLQRKNPAWSKGKQASGPAGSGKKNASVCGAQLASAAWPCRREFESMKLLAAMFSVESVCFWTCWAC